MCVLNYWSDFDYFCFSSPNSRRVPLIAGGSKIKKENIVNNVLVFELGAEDVCFRSVILCTYRETRLNQPCVRSGKQVPTTISSVYSSGILYAKSIFSTLFVFHILRSFVCIDSRNTSPRCRQAESDEMSVKPTLVILNFVNRTERIKI